MHQTTRDFAKYHIHLHTGKAYVKVNKQQYETETIGVFVRQPFLLLAMELMQEIADKEQHFRIGRVSEKMLEVNVSGKM
eukprot:3090976-Ditylum_brightwellii.AAC.1